MTPRKKLIEVALPLDEINKAAVRESYIYRGNPSALHKWWAQRPLAAARAVIFSQMVDDPSEYVDVLLSDPRLRRKAESVLKARRKVWEEARATAERAARGSAEAHVPAPGPEPVLEEIAAGIERERLFDIIRKLVKWENTTNETVLQAARAEIWQSWRRTCAENADHPRAKELFDRHKLPAFHDPFAGGGTLPLEAQRLGLESHASDLNPVAVLINKAMIEILPKFAGRPPVNPEARKHQSLFAREWKGAQGLAEDVRYYGQWMRDEAEKRIGHLYPKVEVTPEMVQERPDLKPYAGRELIVIAWLWARTVKSPNPAFAQVDVPLTSTFMLSTKRGKEAYVEPVIESGGYRFTVKVGRPNDADAAKAGTKLSSGANFRCLMSQSPIAADFIRAQGQEGRMGTRLMAIVAEGDRERLYLAPTPDHEVTANSARPAWKPDVEFFPHGLGFRIGNYGMKKWSDLFTSRQLVALATLSDLVREAGERAKRDLVDADLSADPKVLNSAALSPDDYAAAVSLYLAFSMNKTAEYSCTIVPWYTKENRPKGLFARQAIPMVWDFAEVNPLGTIGGTFSASVGIVAGAVGGCAPEGPTGRVTQADAVNIQVNPSAVVSTDPPYYDNVGYADLSDFFYVWLRRSLRPAFPEIFATLVAPKDQELVATPKRHGGKKKAEEFFLDGMTKAMHCLTQHAHSAFPVTIYYAFKQSEVDDESGTSSTGWETFLGAVMSAGLAVTGTWPMRTERAARSRGIGSNALASSIILVCRKREQTAPSATRREFVAALKAELPRALKDLQRGNVVPVDLAQAAIGPGMAVYTRYSKVFDAEGTELTVRQALSLINQILDETLAAQEGDFDSDTRWALAWFEQFGFAAGEFGAAELLSKAKNTSVQGMKDAGLLDKRSPGGQARLLQPDELPSDWDPTTDPRLTAWEIVHHLIRVLQSGGEGAAAVLVAKLGAKAELARELAYRLYALCDRPQKKRPTEALAYNGLIQSWAEIVRLAQEAGRPRDEQVAMFDEAEE